MSEIQLETFVSGANCLPTSAKAARGTLDRSLRLPTAFLFKLLCAACSLIATWFYFRMSEAYLYTGGDGLNYLNSTLQSLHYFSAFQSNHINPYQGFAAPWSFGASWLQPAALLSLFQDLRLGVPAAYTGYFGLFALALFVFGRAIAPNDSKAKIALSCLAIAMLLFPPATPLYYSFGFQLYNSIAVPSLMVAAVVALLAFLVRLDSDRRYERYAAAVAIAVLTLFAATVDPLWLSVAAVGALPFGLIMVVLPFSTQSILRRLIPLAIILGAFYAVGTVDYLLGSLLYSNRTYFSNEIMNAKRDLRLIYYAFMEPAPFRVFLVMIAGMIMALWHSSKYVRAAAIAGLASAMFVSVYSFAWLFYPKDWWLPLATYMDIFTVPVFALIAMLGWILFAQKALRWLRLDTVTSAWRATIANYRQRIVPGFDSTTAWLLVPAVLTIAVVGLVISGPSNAVPQFDLIRRPPPTGSAGELLKKEVSVRAGDHFRGSVAMVLEAASDQRSLMLDWTLWRDQIVSFYPTEDLWFKDIPTYDVYNPVIAPDAYYVLSRLISDMPYQARNVLPYPSVSSLSLKVLEAVGVRFFLSTQPFDDTLATLASLRWRMAPPDRTFNIDYTFVKRERVTGEAYIYELADPNLGSYSPTRVRVERVAGNYLAVLGADGFDFRHDVVLTAPIDAPLVPAYGARMYFTDKGIRIIAASPGKSLLVLPVQYSRCLEFRRPTEARLVRANLFQVGVLFERNIDETFDFDTGPLINPRCRKEDLKELTDLRVSSDGRVAAPPMELVAPYVGKPILPFLKTHFARLLFGR
jgi:hypothetical protein